MELFCYQAECGDAIRIRFIGNDGNPHNIFLDSGYERTFRHILQQEINLLIQNGESIDLWVISHIHDDHIGGVIKYIKSVKDREAEDISKNWYYNPPRKHSVSNVKNGSDISTAKSIRQGDILFEFLLENGKLPSCDITTDLPCQDLFGLKIHILSPTPFTLDKLRGKYKSDLPFAKNELDSISKATSVCGFDYTQKIESFDIDEFNEDDSLENESCISLLIEYQDKKVLWLADSHPSIIQESLFKKGYSINQPLECDHVIVSHHASKGNNSSELYNMIKSNNYIISSNGENRHCLPTKQALSKIIRNKYRNLSETYSLYFTYDNEILRSIFTSDGDSVFDTWNFRTIYSNQNSNC